MEDGMIRIELTSLNPLDSYHPVTKDQIEVGSYTIIPTNTITKFEI